MNEAEEEKRRAIVALQRKERIGYIEAKRRVEEAMPETAAPPAVRCSEWVAELEAALRTMERLKESFRQREEWDEFNDASRSEAYLRRWFVMERRRSTTTQAQVPRS